MHAPIEGSPGPTRRLALVAVLFVALLAIGVRLIGFTDAWSGRGDDFHALFGAFATGGPARNFAEHGFGESLGMPYDWRVVYSDGAIDHGWYAHHPALYMWIAGLAVEWLGPEPYALRSVALVLSLFCVLACGLFAKELWGVNAGLVAALLVAALPLGWRTGMLPWTEAAIAGCLALAAREQLRFLRGGPPRHLRLAALWILAGALLDWPAHFGSAALFFHVLLFARARLREPGVKASLALYPIVSFGALGMHALHMAVSMGKEAAHGDTEGTLGGVMTLSEPLGRFLSLQLAYLERYLTWSGLVLVGIGALLLLMRFAERRTRAEAALVATLLVPGVLYIGLFPGRSVNHDFFFVVSLPFVACAGVLAIVQLGAWLRQRSAKLAPVAFVPLLVVAAHGIWQGHTQWLLKRSPEFGALVQEPWLRSAIDDPDAVVLTHLGRGMFLPFHSRAALVHSVDTSAALVGWREKLLARTEPERPLWFLVDATTIALLPDGTQLLATLAEHGLPERYDDAPGGPMALVNLRGGPR